MLVSFMTLAFFYLVIGDLITFHQKAIFNYDVFAGQPLSKPDKSDKGSIYKLKDKKDRIIAKFLTFVSEHVDINDLSQNLTCIIIDVPIVLNKIIYQPDSSVSFRGPPSL